MYTAVRGVLVAVLAFRLCIDAHEALGLLNLCSARQVYITYAVQFVFRWLGMVMLVRALSGSPCLLWVSQPFSPSALVAILYSRILR
jgi:hypothetical protein